jgi:hypothetical protein
MTDRAGRIASKRTTLTKYIGYPPILREVRLASMDRNQQSVHGLDLNSRSGKCLPTAVRGMAAATVSDWKKWKKSRSFANHT